MNCSICKRELDYRNKYHKRRRGWFHKETNSIYIMKCKDCGFEGGNRITCPNCGSKNYVDDHCALPNWRVEPTGNIIPQEDWFKPISKLKVKKGG